MAAGAGGVPSGRQLLYALTGPTAYRRDGLCPVSWKHYFDARRFDLSLCWVELLPLVPLAILLPFGAAEAWSLTKLEKKRLSGFRGLGLYRSKLVSFCSSTCSHVIRSEAVCSQMSGSLTLWPPSLSLAKTHV